MVFYILVCLCLRRLCAAEAICFHRFRCPGVCTVVPCQHGLVRMAGESITHRQQRRHHMTSRGLWLSSLVKILIYLFLAVFSLVYNHLLACVMS